MMIRKTHSTGRGEEKHTTFFIVALTAFLGDYASAGGVPTIVIPGSYWGLTPNQVNYVGNLNVIMLYILIELQERASASID